jgi:antitoxin CptB
MSPAAADDRTRERIRWHCRRGLLELDLVLNAFLERHFDGLDSANLEAFSRLLARTDPELLDLVMGHAQPTGWREEALVALLRSDSCKARQPLRSDSSR